MSQRRTLQIPRKTFRARSFLIGQFSIIQKNISFFFFWTTQKTAGTKCLSPPSLGQLAKRASSPATDVVYRWTWATMPSHSHTNRCKPLTEPRVHHHPWSTSAATYMLVVQRVRGCSHQNTALASRDANTTRRTFCLSTCSPNNI